MNLKEVKKEKTGVVKYRYPDVSEVMILLGQMGVDPETLGQKTNKEINEDLIFIGKLLKNMGFLIEEIDLKTEDGESVDSYEEALKHFEFMEILSEVAGNVVKAFEVGKKKKRRSKKQ